MFFHSPWDPQIGISTYIWQNFTVNVGEYSSPMGHLGLGLMMCGLMYMEH